MNALLARLVGEARAEVETRRGRTSSAELERRALAAAPARDFAAALKRPTLAVIAEMKARTPLKGSLTESYDPRRLASTYVEGGAAALSVLCQSASFGGSPDHLEEVREVSRLPIMRKDFVVDEYQVLEARAFDADACLLIVAALSAERLRSLLDCVRQLGMQALVETHTLVEVDSALAAGARVIGVNHRDLDTFDVDMSLTAKLRALIPAECVVVSESGIQTAEDARALRQAGADAVLVGEALMRSADAAGLIRELSAA